MSDGPGGEPGLPAVPATPELPELHDLPDLPDVVDGVRWVVRTAFRSAVTVAGWYERQTLTLLRQRMDAVAPPDEDAAPRLSTPEPLGSKLARLLDRALEQNSASSREELFHKLVDQLVPDEARILGALSDGSASPTVHVFQRTRTGMAGDPILENMSLIGREANLTLPQLTPMYVGHLLSLGLVESGPEEPTLKAEYEILAADTVVLRAIRHGSRGPLPPRVERGSLRLSVLGSELWRAAVGELG